MNFHRFYIEDDSSGDVHVLTVATTRGNDARDVTDQLKDAAAALRGDDELDWGWIVDHFIEILLSRDDLFVAWASEWGIYPLYNTRQYVEE